MIVPTLLPDREMTHNMVRLFLRVMFWVAVAAVAIDLIAKLLLEVT